jgi:molecular chaperone GrpE
VHEDPEAVTEEGAPDGAPSAGQADDTAESPGESPRTPSEDRPGGDPSSDVRAEPAVEEEPDFKDLYLRARAESENVRKRARRDVEVASARGVARLARELLPALDNLDRALAAAEVAEGEGEHELTRGIRLVQQELLAAMARVGIEPSMPLGEAFDPHHHEAVAQQPAPEGAEPGQIVQVYQAGYRYKDEVLRAAKVVVAA